MFSSAKRKGGAKEFLQIGLWLPEDEAAQLRFEFEAEMTRLQAA